MITPFDIFKVAPRGSVLWLESALEFETAKQRVRTLMEQVPNEYLICSQAIGNKISIKPNDKVLGVTG